MKKNLQYHHKLYFFELGLQKFTQRSLQTFQ